jgi:hypothetical protein
MREAMRMSRRVTALVVFLLALFAAVALASTKSVTDKKGDSRKGYPDLKSVKVKTTANRITATLVAYNSFSKKQSPCFSITTNQQHVNGDGYVVCGDGKLMNFARGMSAGTVKLTHPNATTAVYYVSRRQVGNPSSFRWMGQVRGLNDACVHKFRDVCDFAPEIPKRIQQTF